MILKDMRFRKLVSTFNKVYLDYVHEGFFKDVVYGVDIVTGLYSFWKYKNGNLVLIDRDLPREQAKFKLLVLMNKGEKLC